MTEGQPPGNPPVPVTAETTQPPSLGDAAFAAYDRSIALLISGAYRSLTSQLEYKQDWIDRTEYNADTEAQERANRYLELQHMRSPSYGRDLTGAKATGALLGGMAVFIAVLVIRLLLGV